MDLPDKWTEKMTHYLEFLAEAHRILQPRGYLEIGVRHGDSLRLASCPAIGIDPVPNLTRELDHTTLFPMTSDEYFNSISSWVPMYEGHPFDIDLAFIDGMHLVENALRDFTNIEKYSNERTVVIFDDVLPYNDEIASRTPPPGGDWTGDVWRVWPILNNFRPDLDIILVDTEPTGLLLAAGLDPSNRALDAWLRDEDGDLHLVARKATPPRYILRRLNTASPTDALAWLTANADR